MTIINSIDKVVDTLIESENITALTGAGISAESGISTFRDPEGLWAKFNPQELASIDGFVANPERVWSWYQYRVNIVKNSYPNAGHLVLAEFQYLNKNFKLITQNVDGLHQQAGSKNVIELHGSIVRNKCFNCEKIHKEKVKSGEGLYKCKHCDGLIRPDVVWFGEALPESEIRMAQEISTNSDLFFSVGTSAEVYPAAELPLIAKRNGAIVVEINPEKTQISNYVDIRIELNSGEALPLIVEKFNMRIKE